MLGYRRIILVGRLVKDPEIKGDSEQPFVMFSLAVSDSKDTTVYFDCVAFRQNADFLSNYGSKGRLVFVEGVPDLRKTKVGKRFTVIANIVRFLDRQSDSGRENSSESSASVPESSKVSSSPAVALVEENDAGQEEEEYDPFF